MTFQEEVFDPGETFGPCRLCRNEAALQRSHVVPKFVFRWLKETGSRYLRSADRPNVRHQDGPMFPWLCQRCEQRFSRLETSFADRLFRPWLTLSSRRIAYTAVEYDFALSMLWRALLASTAMPTRADRCAQAREAWRRRLLDPSQPSPEIHLGLLGLTQIGVVVPVPNFNRYMTRGIDLTIAADDDGIVTFMFVRFARFMLFGAIDPLPGGFSGTRLDPAGGVLLPDSQRIDDPRIGQFLLERAKGYAERREAGLSNNQRAVIAAEARRDRERLQATPLMAAIRADTAGRIQERSAPSYKVGRNEPCPCGSGAKYKRCHGRRA